MKNLYIVPRFETLSVFFCNCSLTEALRRNHVYRNKQVVVRVGKLLRKPLRNPKTKG